MESRDLHVNVELFDLHMDVKHISPVWTSFDLNYLSLHSRLKMNSRSGFEFDKRIQLPCNVLIVGATQSGKTTLFHKSLSHIKENFNPPPSDVIILYKCFQPGYLELKQTLTEQGVNSEFIQSSTLTESDLKSFCENSSGQVMIAIDDSTMTTSRSDAIAHLFTVARHFNCSIFLFWHTLFAGTSQARIISQNTCYFLLMSCPRLLHQVGSLGSQIGRRKDLITAYKDAVSSPYSYVLLDLHVRTPDQLRIRSKVFHHEGPVQIVYV